LSSSRVQREQRTDSIRVGREGPPGDLRIAAHVRKSSRSPLGKKRGRDLLKDRPLNEKRSKPLTWMYGTNARRTSAALIGLLKKKGTVFSQPGEKRSPTDLGKVRYARRKGRDCSGDMKEKNIL